MYLTEHRNTHHELVIKAINSKNMSVEEFLREFHHSMILGSHRNILTVFPDMVYQLEGQCCMFATEYAPLGDLTSNINDQGIGKKHALKKYDEFAIFTSCFWGSTGSNITPSFVQFNEIFVTKIMNK